MSRPAAAIALMASIMAGCNASPAALLSRPVGMSQPQTMASQGETEARRIFTITDANRDGRVTLAELIKAPTGQPISGWKPGEKERQAKELLARLDANRDGALSFDEFMAGMVGQAMTGRQSNR